jgi:hypothetical protein
MESWATAEIRTLMTKRGLPTAGLSRNQMLQALKKTGVLP